VLLLALLADPRGVGGDQLGFGRLLGRKGALFDRDQEVAERLLQAGTEFLGLGAQLDIRECDVLRFELVDAGHGRFKAADLAFIRVRQPGEELQHREVEYSPMSTIVPGSASADGER
jgi:hypothetical protein